MFDAKAAKLEITMFHLYVIIIIILKITFRIVKALRYLPGSSLSRNCVFIFDKHIVKVKRDHLVFIFIQKFET